MPSTATELSRRSALSLLAAGTAWPAGSLACPSGATFLSSRRMPDGENVATLVSETGQTLLELPFDDRGHGGAVSPDGRFCALFARRPGTTIVIIDRQAGIARWIVRARQDRHFFGHGFYASSGRLLFASENDFDKGRGVLGIYDVTDEYRRVGEFETFGIGPHQCLLSLDGRCAIVANGGIETHPDFPRQKLNLSTMSPSLTRIDIRTGACLERRALPSGLHQLSLRHIAETPDGSVWIGGQYQGQMEDDIPVLAVGRPGAPLKSVDTLGMDGRRGRRYIGSVAANPKTGQVAVTSPRGGLAHILDGRSGEVARRLEIEDVCGIAPYQDGFLFSDGKGGPWHNQNPLLRMPGHAWDNHLTALGPF